MTHKKRIIGIFRKKNKENNLQTKKPSEPVLCKKRKKIVMSVQSLTIIDLIKCGFLILHIHSISIYIENDLLLLKNPKEIFFVSTVNLISSQRYIKRIRRIILLSRYLSFSTSSRISSNKIVSRISSNKIVS